ncbi:hypothetical protein Hanom_Chr03g00223841 [Helianthus anomalus]
MHIHIVYHRITLIPLWGKKKIKDPANIGKTTIIVNQGNLFVVKTRYTLTRKTVPKNKIFLGTGFGGKKNGLGFCNVLISYTHVAGCFMP